MKLTAKQKAFIDEYLVDLNATQAAIRSGYSKKTARQIGEKNLSKPYIQAALEKRMKDRQKRTEITQDLVIAELAKIAFANGADYARVVERKRRIPVLDDDGEIINYEDAPYQDVDLTLTENLSEEAKGAISGIKMTKNGIEVGTHDKVKALELLGKHLGLFIERSKMDISGELSVTFVDDIE